MNASTQHANVPSPCINVCALDDAGFCKGCFRTVAEIKRWKTVSDNERLDILAIANQRRGESSQ